MPNPAARASLCPRAYVTTSMVPAQAEAAATLPPTAALPRLRREPGLGAVEDALAYLECLYAPRVGWPEELNDRLEAMSADATERAYAIDWLTRLLASELAWLEDDVPRRVAYERAATLLTGCTSALESGDVVREFAFPLDGAPTLCLEVRDASLPPSDAHSKQGAAEAAAAVGVQTYASSVIMSDWLVTDLGFFHAAFRGAPCKEPFTIVELGAGTGIVGMVAARILAERGTPKAKVYITDYHADVMANLQYNLDTYLFPDPSMAERVDVVCEPLDWRALHAQLHPDAAADGVVCRLPPPQSASLLLAADVVYDPMHATWLLGAIVYLLRQPDTDPDARAHILVPVRSAGRLAGLYATIDTAIAACAAPHNGYVLTTLSQRTLPRRRGLGRDDEGKYIWTELGWTT